MHSCFKYFFASIMMNVLVDSNNFVSEYFVYKSVSRVTIFSCGDTYSDYRFVREINDLGISVNIIQAHLNTFNASKQILRRDNWAFGLILDTQCQSQEVNERIIEQTSNYELYQGIHIWMILSSNLEETVQLLNDTTYSLLTDVKICVKEEIGYSLYDVYNPCKIRGGSLIVSTFGTWNPEKGLEITLKQSKIERRSNMKGMKLITSIVVQYQPANMKIEDYLQDVTKRKDPISKYGYDIIRQIAELYNFTIEIQLNSEWVTIVNGTEVGLMPRLLKGEADISGSPASATLRFAPYGQMLLHALPYRSFFIFRSNIQRFKWMEVLTPLAPDSWYATLVLTIISIIILTAIEITNYGKGWFVETGNALFSTIGVLCQQGIIVERNRISYRIALIFLLFFGILWLNYYSASVVSSRLKEPVDKMNDSLYMLARSKMEFGSEPFRNVDDNLQSRSVLEWEVRYFYENVWKKLPNSKYIGTEEGLRKVSQGGYAYHTSAEVAYPHVEATWDDEAICEMTEVHVITKRTLAFWGKFDSPFNEILKIGIMKAANVGLRMRAVHRWKPKTPYCSSLARSLQSVTFFEIAPALVLLIIGTALSIGICYVENIIYRLYPTVSISRIITEKRDRIIKKILLKR